MDSKKANIFDKVIPSLLTAFIIGAVGLLVTGASADFAKADKVSDLEKRIIIVEEGQKNTREDLAEIKETTRSIAKYLLEKKK